MAIAVGLAVASKYHGHVDVLRDPLQSPRSRREQYTSVYEGRRERGESVHGRESNIADEVARGRQRQTKRERDMSRHGLCVYVCVFVRCGGVGYDGMSC